MAAETLAEQEKRDTLCIGIVFISLSVPEQSPIGPRDRVPHLAWCCVEGERPAVGRAATPRLAPSLLNVPAMALPTAVAVLDSADPPERGSEVNGGQVE